MSTEERPPRDQGDDVAALVRLAGQRPPIPDERIERARAVARETWLRETRRRTRNRFIYGAVTLAAAASLVLLATVFRPADDGVRLAGVSGSLSLRLLSGEASIEEPVGEALADARALAAAESVPLESVLSTSEIHRAALQLPSGHSLRLDRSTRVRLSGRQTLRLDRGAVYIASRGVDGARESLTIGTELGSVEEIGTQFEVRLGDDSVRVRVREGAIILNHDGGEREARKGTELRLSADGTIAERAVPNYGDEWNWVSETTPMIRLEGHTARTFLDWAVREQGWKLVFADEELARSAGTIEVSGDLSGMTMEQALASVLLSSRMAYRLDNGVLTVEAERAGPGA